MIVLLIMLAICSATLVTLVLCDGPIQGIVTIILMMAFITGVAFWPRANGPEQPVERKPWNEPPIE